MIDNSENIKIHKETFFQKAKLKFFQYIFYDTHILFKVLYHKYFANDIFIHIVNTNAKKLASDLNLQNEIRVKSKNNLIYPSKTSIEEKLSIQDVDNYPENKLDEFELEKKSREYLKEYIRICKFNWLNNFTTFSFFSLLGFSCLVFKYHKRHKKISNRMFIIVLCQILLNTTCIYLSLRTHPNESYLNKAYYKEIEKYKIIYKE